MTRILCLHLDGRVIRAADEVEFRRLVGKEFGAVTAHEVEGAHLLLGNAQQTAALARHLPHVPRVRRADEEDSVVTLPRQQTVGSAVHPLHKRQATSSGEQRGSEEGVSRWSPKQNEQNQANPCSKHRRTENEGSDSIAPA